MAKKNKNVVLENIELKPQVIGTTYQKKNNLLRVIIIFIVLILAVQYIDVVSSFINKALGRNTSVEEPIKKDNGTNDNNKSDVEEKEIKHYTITDDLTIELDELVVNNFKNNNNYLAFSITNNSNNSIDLKSRKFYLETYTSDNTLLERYKINLKTLSSKAKENFSFNLTKTFNNIVIVEKNIEDYPTYTLNASENGVGKITCKKNNDTIEYVFLNDTLQTIKHTIQNNNINDYNYNTNLLEYENKVVVYNNTTGMNATLNKTDNGYTVIIDINAGTIDLSKLNELYYYNSNTKEAPRVIHFEMMTYGFNCY